MADLATLQSRLAEAEGALHKLNIGAQLAQVGKGDMNFAYTKATIGDLRSYIDDLRAQIVAAGGTVDGLRRRGITVDLP